MKMTEEGIIQFVELGKIGQSIPEIAEITERSQSQVCRQGLCQ